MFGFCSLRAPCVLALALLAPVAAASELPDLAAFEGRTVAAVVYVGNKVTRDHILTRELQTRAGEPFSVATLRADVRRLENLGIFAGVKASAEEAGGGVKITLEVKEMPALIPYPTFTYTEENGFSYGAALSAGNFKGEAIRLSGRAYFGGTKQYWARLDWPWVTGNHMSLGFYGAHLERQDKLNGFKENSLEVTPTVGTWLGKSGRLRGMVSYFKMRSDVPGKTVSADNQDQFVRVGAALGYDTRDSWVTPRHGWRNELEVWRTDGSGGGFWSMNLDLRRYQPTARRQHLLLSSLLSLQSGEVGTDVPQYLTYHVGGASSIRGYALEDLATDTNGKNQLLTTAEYNLILLPADRHDIFKWSFNLGLALAVFGDAGIAWNQPEDFGREHVHGGLGAGLRILIPGTEQVRFDVGWSHSGGFEFHFASGTKPDAQRRRLR